MGWSLPCATGGGGENTPGLAFIEPGSPGLEGEMIGELRT